MAKFVVGRTYQCRLVGDHNSVFRYEVISRTKAFITIKDSDKTKKIKIHTNEVEEYCYPDGQYSMCPVLKASSAE